MSRPCRPARLSAFFSLLFVLAGWLSLERTARAQGSDTCATPPLLTSAGDSGTTAGASNDTTTVGLDCNGIYTSVAGPDVFYEVVVGTGNSFTITVTPSAPYDTSIYLTAPTCGDGSTCALGWGSDDFGPGVAETLTLSGLTPGIYYLGIDSFYGAGDPNNRESGSYTVAVSGSLGTNPTNTTLVAAPLTSVYGQSVSFTATVTGFSGPAVGSVAFSLDAQAPVIVSVDPVTGNAVFVPASALAPGGHTVSATYGPSGIYATSMATPVTENVGQATTTTALITSGSPSMLGGAVTFTASVVASAPGAGLPTGIVTFTIDGTPQTPASVDGSGNAAFTTSALGSGGHAIVATYSGDPNFLGSGSATLTQVVTAAPTTTTVVAAPEPTVYGQAVTFTATVSGGPTPTGNVSFSLDGGPGTNVMLTGGQATLATSTLAPGSHTVAVVYGGDAAHAASSGSTMHVVTGASTATSLMISPTPAAIALQVVTLTATVVAIAPGAGTPSGVVSFSDGGTVFGSATIVGGVATLPCGFDAGTHSISAVYSGGHVLPRQHERSAERDCRQGWHDDRAGDVGEPVAARGGAGTHRKRYCESAGERITHGHRHVRQWLDRARHRHGGHERSRGLLDLRARRGNVLHHGELRRRRRSVGVDLGSAVRADHHRRRGGRAHVVGKSRGARLERHVHGDGVRAGRFGHADRVGDLCRWLDDAGHRDAGRWSGNVRDFCSRWRTPHDHGDLRGRRNVPSRRGGESRRDHQPSGDDDCADGDAEPRVVWFADHPHGHGFLDRKRHAHGRGRLRRWDVQSGHRAADRQQGVARDSVASRRDASDSGGICGRLELWKQHLGRRDGTSHERRRRRRRFGFRHAR